MLKKTACVALLAALPLAFAGAQENKAPKAAPETAKKTWFEKMDANGDGKVSKEEWVKARESRFSAMDKNSDGFIDKDEWQAKREKMREHKDKKHMEMMEE